MDYKLYSPITIQMHIKEWQLKKLRKKLADPTAYCENLFQY